MFDSVIAITFVFSLLSPICSSLREGVESLVAKRASALRARLDLMVGQETTSAIYQHPLMRALGERPAHIPPNVFSRTLLDVLKNVEQPPGNIQATIRALGSEVLEEAELCESIERWFNAAMDALSASYKRHTHAWLALIGVAVTVVTNADSIRISSTLLKNATIREAAVQSAANAGSDSPSDIGDAAARLLSVGLPIGWTGGTRDNTLPWKQPWEQYPPGQWRTNAWLLLQWHWAGWLLTLAAISLGAPFWFDALRVCLPLRRSAT